ELNKHRHTSAVFARIKNLARLVVVGIEVHFGLAKHAARTRLQVVTEDSSRRSEAGERIKRFGIRAFPAKPASRTNSRQGNLPHECAVQTEDLHLAVRVLQVGANELVVDR